MMKLQNVPLDQIVWNPWRDKDLYPIDEDHVKELRDSINDHGFFSSVKGRRVNGKIEIGCGHARITAARKAKLDTVPVFIDDLDDDEMLRLMTDENALQAGANPGAVLNEVAAVTRRLIDALLSDPDNCPDQVARAIEGGQKALHEARGKLRNGKNAHLVLGYTVIRRYLGSGNPDRAHRAERQIREAIGALKQSGRYDEIVDKALLKHPPPVDAKPSKSKEVAKVPQPKPRERVLDERTANVFKNENQFHAFREAVTTSAAKRVIPVTEQLALAKEIMRPKEGRHDVTQKTVPASTIKIKVQEHVQDALKEQRKIDQEERERYLAEQVEAQIDEELDLARRWLKSLIASMLKLEKLAEKYPHHPKIGGFGAKLDDLVNAIHQFSRKLK